MAAGAGMGGGQLRLKKELRGGWGRNRLGGILPAEGHHQAIDGGVASLSPKVAKALLRECRDDIEIFGLEFAQKKWAKFVARK